MPDIKNASKMTDLEISKFIRETAKRTESKSQFILIAQQSFYQDIQFIVTPGRDKRSALCLVTLMDRSSFNVPLYGLNWS